MQDDLIAVTQADREAAASYHRDMGGAPTGQRRIAAGEFDSEPEVQAFARHRQQAEEAMRERCAVIADEWAATCPKFMKGLGVSAILESGRFKGATEVATAIRAATLSKEVE